MIARTVLEKDIFENRHRERKRWAEMEIIREKLMPFLERANRTIFEFGSGEGYQIPFLKKMGDLVTSDIYKSDRIKRLYPETKFVICDITNAPFASESFDFIFSNHVLEHIKNTKKAFAELKRIGKDGCIYAFTVPTAVWLLLSIPAQYHNGLRKLLNRTGVLNKAKRGNRAKGNEITAQKRKSLWREFLPRGHGWRKNFFECFVSLRIRNWQKLFCENGFRILDRAPLLLYAPSEFPIIPTTKFLTSKGICSSAIFIMRKDN
jgi:SAM-dependent methyltransferase